MLLVIIMPRFLIMGARVSKNIKVIIENESGQALFELMIFMPFLIYFFTLIINIGNSINASINQQKVVRSYFHHRASGNSNLPTKQYLNRLNNIQEIGMDFVGWQVKAGGDGGETPIAPCFKLGSLFGDGGSETCEDKGTATGENKSNFIRIYTAYGICSASYGRESSGFVHRELNRGASSCSRR